MVVVLFSAEMTMPLPGVMTIIAVMIGGTDLMIVMATIGEMTYMAAVVATVGMIEMGTTEGMTDNTAIVVMIGGIIGVMTETCNAVMEVAVVVVAVVVAADAHLLALLIPPVRFAPSMAILHVIAGGATPTVMMMMMRTVLVMKRAHTEWTLTCIWTLAPHITSQDN
jgi:hypothetical protein